MKDLSVPDWVGLDLILFAGGSFIDLCEEQNQGNWHWPGLGLRMKAFSAAADSKNSRHGILDSTAFRESVSTSGDSSRRFLIAEGSSAKMWGFGPHTLEEIKISVSSSLESSLMPGVVVSDSRGFVLAMLGATLREKTWLADPPEMLKMVVWCLSIRKVALSIL